jgi:hypothetical protein
VAGGLYQKAADDAEDHAARRVAYATRERGPELFRLAHLPELKALAKLGPYSLVYLIKPEA